MTAWSGLREADMSIATATELWRMSAIQLAEAIRSRQVSSRDVIEAHLQRIEAVNGSINAVVVVMAEEALKAARMADRASQTALTSGRSTACRSP
jgi:amidase